MCGYFDDGRVALANCHAEQVVADFDLSLGRRRRRRRRGRRRRWLIHHFVVLYIPWWWWWWWWYRRWWWWWWRRRLWTATMHIGVVVVAGAALYLHSLRIGPGVLSLSRTHEQLLRTNEEAPFESLVRSLAHSLTHSLSHTHSLSRARSLSRIYTLNDNNNNNKNKHGKLSKSDNDNNNNLFGCLFSLFSSSSFSCFLSLSFSLFHTHTNTHYAANSNVPWNYVRAFKIMFTFECSRNLNEKGNV